MSVGEGAIAGLCARPRGLSSERDNHEAALAPTSLAFLLNVSLTLSLEAAGVPVTFSTRSVYSPAVVGLATAAANLFTLLAYASTVLVLEERFTWRKLFAIALAAAGTFLLQRADA